MLMTVGEMIKKYRNDNALSQKELAERLCVSEMTISRIEAGNKIRLTPAFKEAMLQTFSEDDILELDDRNDFNRQIQSLWSVSQLRAYQENEIAVAFTNQIKVLGFTGCIKNNYIKDDRSMSAVIFDYTFKNPSLGKIWVVDIMVGPGQKKNLTSRLLTGIGKCACTTLANKYSIISEQNSIEFFEKRPEIRPDRIGCDISFLHFNGERIDGEVDLALYKDGRGIFDLDVPDKAQESSMLYAKWKTSF